MTEQGELKDTFKMAHAQARVAQRTPKPPRSQFSCTMGEALQPLDRRKAM
jgi:hypothetical protein